ncbi:MAG: IS21 family transposase [Pseudomonadota bacterium]
METVIKVRRWVMAEGLSIREVSRRTGLSRNTVRKYLRSEHSEPRYRQHKPRALRSLLEYEARLRALFEADSQRAPRERRSLRGLYDALVLEGFEGSYDTVRRYVLRLKACRGEARGYVPLEFDAGDALQFDWSHERVCLGGVDTKVYVAHFRLCHARKPFVRAYLRESQEMVLDAFNQALAFYAGVPGRAIIDNAKTMVVFTGKGKERVFHPRFLALMSHYAMEPVACSPASGWEKGQVEHQVKTLRGQIFTPKLAFDTLADLNRHLAARCEALALKTHPEDKTRSIAAVFEDERAQLRPVGRAFDGYAERPARVSGTCLVQYDTNSYSVPCTHTFQTVSLRAYADRIVVSDGQQILAEHARCFGRYQKRFCLWHYLPLFQQRPGALRDGAPFKHWQPPKPLAMIWEHYRRQPGGDRDFVELLTLYQEHGQEAVAMACELALEYKTLQLSAIIALLHDLTEPVAHREMAVEAVSYPQLQRPPEANCQRYDQLLGAQRAQREMPLGAPPRAPLGAAP